MVELRQAADKEPIVNLIHPSPIDSQAVLGPISGYLDLPIEPYKEWLDRLRKVKSSVSNRPAVVEQVPALKLLDFYEAMGTESRGGLMEVRLDVTPTVRVSKSLADEALHPLGENDALKWVHRWL